MYPITMSNTKRRPYTKSKRTDKTCRNHGSCDYCVRNRRYQYNKEMEWWKIRLKDYLNG